MGFKVVAATADGASPNHRLFALSSDPKLTYAPEKRYLRFISPPKDNKNCLASKARSLWVSFN